MKTGIYVRVSTDEQAKEGYSIKAQIEKLKNYVAIKEWEFYKVYADEGISGKNITDRPAINELIADIKNGNVDNVLVFKIDRLTRSTRDLIELTDIFNTHDCAFNSLMESIDTNSPSGRMFLKIIGIFAEFERENLIERVTLGLEKKAKEGYGLANNIISYGYNKRKGQKVQSINEEEAKIVKEIFEKYIYEDMTLRAIAINLNLRDIPTKFNSTWTHAGVKEILKNVNYIGKIRYAQADEKRGFITDGKHKPIIDNILFEKAQAKLEKCSFKRKARKPRDENYYYGSLYCALCGKKLVTHNKYRGEKHLSQYLCPNRRYKACDSMTMSHKNIENAFTEYIENYENLATDEIELDKKSYEK